MSQYMTVPENENKPMMYNLTAVLIHKGPSAYSGHYVGLYNLSIFCRCVANKYVSI